MIQVQQIQSTLMGLNRSNLVSADSALKGSQGGFEKKKNYSKRPKQKVLPSQNIFNY